MRTIFSIFVIALASCATHVDDKFEKLLCDVHDRPESVQAHIALAQYYHWHKDFSSAEREYQTAVQIDARCIVAFVPLLDELKRWDAIIALVRREQWSNLPAGILGSVATAYHEKGNDLTANLIVEELRRRVHLSDDEEDYRHYQNSFVACISSATVFVKTKGTRSICCRSPKRIPSALF